MGVTMIPFSSPKAQYHSIKSEIDAAVHQVLEGGQYIGGEFVRQFESDFALLQSASHCIGVGNGTDAILIALKCLDIRPGDEIIVPAFGWLSAAEMVTLAGGKPVFCDVLPSGVIDPAKIEARINDRTRGVIIIHLYGQAAHAHFIKGMCQEKNIFLIEDCAQAHLTRENDVAVGTIGDAGAFSFYPTKNLGAYGDGGCIVTQDKRLSHAMRLYANHGGLMLHEIEGINSRLDPLQAAILSVKCSYVAAWTDQRIAIAGRYSELLAGRKEIDLPAVRPNTKHTFHQFVVRTTARDELKSFLELNKIQTLIHYPRALHNMPAYRHLNFRPEDFPEATRCQEQVLSLPIYPELTSDQMLYVAEHIDRFFTTK